MLDGDTAWRHLMLDILEHGKEVSPRGQPTIEVLHTNNIVLDMGRAVVTSPERKLNYQFMCAEALWILDGDNQLEPLTKYNKRMAQFSDDGETLAGAYGPRIMPQIQYVVNALWKDRDTRQATLSIWTPNPEPSKDMPCTVAMVFSIRDSRLHQHVFMRSSDAWLGIPYDIFRFACVGLHILAEFNNIIEHNYVSPGQLTISMTSSHIYKRDFEKVFKVLKSPTPEPIPYLHEFFNSWGSYHDALVDQRSGKLNRIWTVVPEWKDWK